MINRCHHLWSILGITCCLFFSRSGHTTDSKYPAFRSCSNINSQFYKDCHEAVSENLIQSKLKGNRFLFDLMCPVVDKSNEKSSSNDYILELLGSVGSGAVKMASNLAENLRPLNALMTENSLDRIISDPQLYDATSLQCLCRMKNKNSDDKECYPEEDIEEIERKLANPFKKMQEKRLMDLAQRIGFWGELSNTENNKTCNKSNLSEMPDKFGCTDLEILKDSLSKLDIQHRVTRLGGSQCSMDECRVLATDLGDSFEPQLKGVFGGEDSINVEINIRQREKDAIIDDQVKKQTMVEFIDISRKAYLLVSKCENNPSNVKMIKFNYWLKMASIAENPSELLKNKISDPCTINFDKEEFNNEMSKLKSWQEAYKDLRGFPELISGNLSVDDPFNELGKLFNNYPTSPNGENKEKFLEDQFFKNYFSISDDVLQAECKSFERNLEKFCKKQKEGDLKFFNDFFPFGEDSKEDFNDLAAYVTKYGNDPKAQEDVKDLYCMALAPRLIPVSPEENGILGQVRRGLASLKRSFQSSGENPYQAANSNLLAGAIITNTTTQVSYKVNVKDGKMTTTEVPYIGASSNPRETGQSSQSIQNSSESNQNFPSNSNLGFNSGIESGTQESATNINFAKRERSNKEKNQDQLGELNRLVSELKTSKGKNNEEIVDQIVSKAVDELQNQLNANENENDEKQSVDKNTAVAANSTTDPENSQQGPNEDLVSEKRKKGVQAGRSSSNSLGSRATTTASSDRAGTTERSPAKDFSWENNRTDKGFVNSAGFYNSSYTDGEQYAAVKERFFSMEDIMTNAESVYKSGGEETGLYLVQGDDGRVRWYTPRPIGENGAIVFIPQGDWTTIDNLPDDLKTATVKQVQSKDGNVEFSSNRVIMQKVANGLSGKVFGPDEAFNDEVVNYLEKLNNNLDKLEN